MSRRSPRLTGVEMVRLLERAGFVRLRIRGSHHVMRRTTVVPVHAGETLGPGLTAKILRDTNLTEDELDALR